VLRVSRILAQAGLVDPSWFTQESRDRGHVVHAIGEAYLRKQDIEFGRSFDGYAKALRDGLATLDFQPVCIERRLVMHDITGRPDAIGWLPRPVGRLMSGPTILDIKSGARKPAHGIQLAFYETLANATPDLRLQLPDALAQLPWQRVGFYVKDTGRYTLHPYDDYNDRLVAEALIDITKWRIANGLLKVDDVALQDDDPSYLEAYQDGRRTLDGA